MLDTPCIVVALAATPNKRIAGQRFNHHDTEPTRAMRLAALNIAEAFLEQIGEAATSIQLIELEFVRGQYLNELELHCRLVVTVRNSEPLEIKRQYLSFSNERRRTLAHLQEFFIKPLRNQLAEAIVALRSAQERQATTTAAATDKLLTQIGMPDWSS